MTSTPPTWTNAPITLYHGTIEQLVPSILSGIDLRFAQPGRDFGLGFYTTTLQRQAEEWGKRLSLRLREQPAVVAYDVPRDSIASLEALWFVRGEYEAAEFWSFVSHCRNSPKEAFTHLREINRGLYDIVVGPVAAFPEQRVIAYGYDQVSFHTARAVAVLDASKKRRVL